MDQLILRCLPQELRVRYAEEIQELLDRSHHRVRDRTDLLVAAIGLRFESMLFSCVVATAVCLGLSVAALAHSIRNLNEGAVDVLNHWWSTMALGGCVASLLTMAILSIARHRARSWSPPT